MDFNLINSSFPHVNRTENIDQLVTAIANPDDHKYFLHSLPGGIFYQESSSPQSSSDFESPTTFTAAPPHLHNNAYPLTPPHDFSISFCHDYPNNTLDTTMLHKRSDSMEAMREMIFRMAMMQPVQVDPEQVKPPQRKNVRISKDPQSVAARHRRERISQRIRILQRMVPGGTKLDTASMLDEAVHYLKFLKKQVQSLEQAAQRNVQMQFT